MNELPSRRTSVIKRCLGLSALGLMIVSGCSPRVSSKPVVEETSRTAHEASPAPPPLASPVPTALKMPVVKKRSAESLRERIRTTVAQLQADAEPRRRRQAWHQIAQGLLAFEQQHGHLPTDNGAEPDSIDTGLSWRVHLLPFVGEAALHREFHLDEPWDSPHNGPLAERMPKIYGDDALGLTPIIHPPAEFLKADVLFVVAPEDAGELWSQPGSARKAEPVIPTAVAFRDGRLMAVKPDVTVVHWQDWWRSPDTRDKLPECLIPLPVSSRAPVVISAATSSNDIAAASLPTFPAETWCAVHLQPRRLLLHPLRAALFRSLLMAEQTHAPPNGLQTALSSYGKTFRQSVDWLTRHQLEPDQLESLTVMIPWQVLKGPVPAAEGFAVIGHAAGDFHVEALLEAEMAPSSRFHYREQGATAGIVDLQQSLALHFANDRTVLLGGQSLVLALSEARPDDSPLTAWLSSVGSMPLAVVLSAEPIQEWLRQHPVGFPPPLQGWLPVVMDAQGVVAAVDPDGDTLVTLRITFRQASSAARLKSLVDEHQQQYRDRVATTAAPLDVSWLSVLWEGLQVDAVGEEFRVTITRPAHFEVLLQGLLKDPL